MDYGESLLSVFFGTQARPCDLASGIPSKSLHLRSLNNALKIVRLELSYVVHALEAFDDMNWCLVEDTIAGNLSGGVLRLEGVMDGLSILQSSCPPSADMSFTRTPFDNIRLREIQERVKGLRSAANDSGTYTDFWSLADFWKHHFPYQPRPSMYTRQNVRDFQINLGNGCKSGPVMHDIILPAFNGAVEIVHALTDTMLANLELVEPLN